MLNPLQKGVCSGFRYNFPSVWFAGLSEFALVMNAPGGNVPTATIGGVAVVATGSGINSNSVPVRVASLALGGGEYMTSSPERRTSKTYEGCVSGNPGRNAVSKLKEYTDTHIAGNLRRHKVPRADAPTPSTNETVTFASFLQATGLFLTNVNLSER